MKRFLVTGATGFLGSVLIERLLDNGYKVVGLDARAAGFLSKESIKSKSFKFYKIDLSGNNLNKLVTGLKIDGVFHLAAQQPKHRYLKYGDFYKGNVQTTLNLVKFIRHRNVKFIIYSSTCSIFAKEQEGKHKCESSVSHPVNYYCLTKYIAERLLEIELKKTKTKIAVVRFPSLYGKNHLGGIVHAYYQLCKNGKGVEVFSRGKRFRNLLYVTDAVHILLRVLDNIDKLKQFELFTCGSSDSLKMIEVARSIKQLTGSCSEIILSDKSNPLDHDVFIDLSKARKILKFSPLSIREGLKLYVDEMNEKV